MADMIASREENTDKEIPSSATGGADGVCGAKASVTTGTESRTKKSTVVTVVYSNRASKKSKSRRKTSLTRPQRRKRGTSGNVRNRDATPSAQATSKKQERRDDASTKKRISVVHRALSDPDLLTPVEVDRLVRVVFWKAIHDDDSAEPAARFCARVITVECLRRALTTAGEAAERGAPARMAALVTCLRDAFLSSDVPEDDRLTLLELMELRASGWKLSPEQQLSYASLDDAVGDECDDVQNLSPLPWRIAE
ncbi:uncharacterized protein LOC142786469 isoform X1 [Rhipicephalus microplus]|uniref:uncharacterized protein LOC142786469 isoform X1 n=1 Tax=Rhipicephalus microplus TaxID=6941 RepID=UPI003F6B78EC